MSRFTTEVRYICETLAGHNESVGYNDVSSTITTAAPLLFNFNFPIFDEAYRLPLETKILRHFYTREICEETVGLWKLRMEDKLNLIMPYYNQLYRSELLEFNPMYDVDIATDHTKNANSESNKTATGTTNFNSTVNKNKSDNGGKNYTDNTVINDDSNSTAWDLYSDTPQGGIEGVEGNGNTLGNNYYLTDARKNTDNTERDTTNNTTHAETTTNTMNGTEVTTNTNATNNTATGEITDTETYIEHVRGKRGNVSYSKMLQDFRKTFLNIDQMIINDLESLFFGLWE